MGHLDELVISVISFMAGFGAREMVTDLRAVLRKRREAKDNRGEGTEI